MGWGRPKQGEGTYLAARPLVCTPALPSLPLGLSFASTALVLSLVRVTGPSIPRVGLSFVSASCSRPPIPPSPPSFTHAGLPFLLLGPWFVPTCPPSLLLPLIRRAPAAAAVIRHGDCYCRRRHHRRGGCLLLLLLPPPSPWLLLPLPSFVFAPRALVRALSACSTCKITISLVS